MFEEFYELIKKDYPDLSKKQLEDILKNGLLYQTRKTIESGSLETVRIKHFGKFTVYPKRVAGLKKLYEHEYSNNRMTKKRFDELINSINNYELRQS